MHDISRQRGGLVITYCDFLEYENKNGLKELFKISKHYGKC